MDIVFVGERYSTQLRRLMKSAPCYDIHGDGTNKKCKWKNLIDKEAEEMKDDN